MTVRIRQLVIAAERLDAADALREALGLGEPFIDPGVAEFGLVNRVFAIGDQFLEVVVPVAPSAPAARFIARNGPGGYMAIFQVDDLSAARARADAMGVRRVWNIDLDDIAASHLHPADMGAAIVSMDECRPPSSWRWGGPDWQKRSVLGRLTGARIETPDADALAQKWATVLGADRRDTHLELADGDVEFVPGSQARLSAFAISSPHLKADQTLAGVDLIASAAKKIA